jgi:hypothetical protein
MIIKCLILYSNVIDKYSIIEILDNHIPFSLTNHSKLANQPIKPYFEDVRALNKDGNLKPNIFGVRFIDDVDSSDIKEGAIVELSDVELTPLN